MVDPGVASGEALAQPGGEQPAPYCPTRQPPGQSAAPTFPGHQGSAGSDEVPTAPPWSLRARPALLRPACSMWRHITPRLAALSPSQQPRWLPFSWPPRCRSLLGKPGAVHGLLMPEAGPSVLCGTCPGIRGHRPAGSSPSLPSRLNLISTPHDNQPSRV